MDNGDQELEDFSVSILEVQDRDAIACSELQELKIEGSDCLIYDSLQELNFPCGSIASRDEFSTSRLNIQQNGDDDLMLHDEMKEGTIDNLAYDLLMDQNTPKVSSFWSGRMERVESDSRSSNSTIDDKAEAQLLTQSLEFTKVEEDAAIHGILSMEDITFKSIDLPSEDDQFDEDGSGTDKYMDALNTLESESETDFECQPMQQIIDISAKHRNDEIKRVHLKMHENGQNSEETSDDFVAAAPKFSSPIYSEDLVQAGPPLIAELSCGPDISEVDDLCQRTHNLDAFHSSIMVPSSSGLSMSDIEMHEHRCDMESTIDESLCRSPSSSKEFSKYSEILVHAESPRIASGFSSHDTSEVKCHSKSTENLDVSEVIALDSSVKLPSSSGFNIADSQDPAETVLLPKHQGIALDSSFSASLQPVTEISDTTSIKVWTNGGLLGLEPSKPLSPSGPNVVNNDFAAGSNKNDSNLASGLLMAKSLSNGSVSELEMLIKNPSLIEKNAKSDLANLSTDFACQNDFSGQIVRGSMNVVQAINHFDNSKMYHDKPDDGTAKKNLQILSATAESKFSKWEDSPQTRNFDNIRPNGLIKTSPVKSLAEVPSVHDKVLHSEASQDNINSPTNFGRGAANEKIQNGSFHNSEYEVANLTRVGLMQLNTPDFSAQGEKSGVGERVATFKNEYPVNACSSPPLEHMKISFHPIDVFASSKLKLKFPGVHHFHESIKDVMFPSFHLLPESAITIQDIEFESDDDTFYRSSSCISDEAMSQQSESTFEQWEPSEIPELDGDDVYDALHRISLDESISNAFELCGIENHNIHFDNNFRDHHSEELLEPMHNNHLFDLPTLDAVDPSKNLQEKQCRSDSQDCTNTMPHLCNEPTPLPPPPLPPAQWWVTKSELNEVDNEHYIMSNGPNHLDDEAPEALSLPSSASSKPSPYVARSQDPQFNGHREDDQTVNAKEMNDREDLLLQIRTKSFNLRRTMPAMPLGPSGPETNTKVVAMLEKAQAIRQAYVGSNEGGGDESWSDG
ncbi:hypothetical protein Sjap_026087 [Stephania japonica]|uniref:Protein SCAR n=1 Tax=Stephania japonica TaxID=461633 RepID=A0AAP0E2Y3_9MAGN